MSTTDTQELLRAFVKERSEAAFEELVRRYVDLVYSAALRRMGGATLLAQDVTQVVFTDLARKAASLPPGVMLGGWLHRHTGFVAATVLRSEQRRREREKEAVAMNALNQPSDTDWKQIAPVLDEAIDQLPAADHDAVILRFFEQRDLRSVGVALGATEDAAQKRVTRALEKLRSFLVERGITLSVAALAVALGSGSVSAAPSGFAAGITKTALGSATGGGLVAVLARLLAPATAKLGLATLAVALLAGFWVARHHSAALSPRVADSTSAPAPTLAPGEQPPTQGAVDPQLAATPAMPPDSNALHLVIVAADSGKPVPNVQIDYRGWEGQRFTGRTLAANRLGVCDVDIPRTTVTQLELTTRTDGFADTRLHWQTSSGDKIPTAYTLRLVRPLPIGGLVVDPDGHPIGGAKVGFNHQDDPATTKSPEDHHFGWIQVPTDTNGHWTIDRIAPEMIRSIYGSASHPDFVQAPLIFASQDRRTEQSLRAGSHTFRLGRAVTAHGVVVDAANAPVAGAKILVGQRGASDSRKGESAADGTFTVTGCRPGKTPVSAEADGYSAATIQAELAANSPPVQIVLHRGNVLLLRLADQSGHPVSKAHVWLQTMRQVTINDPDYGKPLVQANFEGAPDAEGLIAWSNAPDSELVFDIAASGYMRVNSLKVHPDGQEHLITLPPAVVVSGTVRDAVTGDPIPKFRVVTGWPVTNFFDRMVANMTNSLTGQTTSKVRIVGGPFAQTTNDPVSAHWSSFARDWLNFTDGKFFHQFEAPLVFGMPNPGYMLRFEADGYAPFTSRPIRADEGEVHLDITLHAAQQTIVTVLLPNGRPAAQADVGLVMPQAGLELVPGGFSHRSVGNGASLLLTDADGTFRLPFDDSIRRVIVAHAAGYAEATPAALASQPTIQLQPWGRLEGTYLVGGQPATNRDLLFQYGGGNIASIHSSFESYRVTTDQAGRFVFEQVPPGSHKIVRLAPTNLGNSAGTSFMHVPVADVEIRPGETTTVTVGGGYSVTARLRWPAGQSPVAAGRVFAHIQTGYPSAMADKLKAALNDPAALASLRESPEAQDYAQRARHFQVVVAQDASTVSAEDIPSGNYILVIGIIPDAASGQPRASTIAAETPFTVPADPTTGSLDLGEIQLR